MDQTGLSLMAEQCVDDPDYIQDHEACKLLSLFSKQIRYAMQESDISVNALTASFMEMIAHINCIYETVQGHPDNMSNKTILSECDAVTKKMQSTIIAFQFYDKLSQRMAHSSDSLDFFNEQLSSQPDNFKTTEWATMLEQINAHYTIEHDRDTFKEVIYGQQTTEASNESENIPDSEEPGDIELF